MLNDWRLSAHSMNCYISNNTFEECQANEDVTEKPMSATTSREEFAQQTPLSPKLLDIKP